MSVIKDRTISATQDKRIVLSNSQFARELPFGTTWNKIRVGVRFHMRNTGADLVSTPNFALGVCSGQTNLYGDATTTHFVGTRSTSASWFFSGGNKYLVSNGTILPHKRVGSTGTSGSAFFPATAWGIGAQAATAGADRSLFFVDILKGSPNFTLQCFGWQNTGAAPVDVSLTNFLLQMELATPNQANHTFSATQTLAVDEGVDGSLDNFMMSWDRTSPEIEVSDIAVTRFL